MKTAHDLVLAAKAQCTEVAVKDAPGVLRSADVIIDVREADEYAAGHLAGAINIPRGLLEFKLSGTPALERRDMSVLQDERTFSTCSNHYASHGIPECGVDGGWI
jgi:rhodanese-related sulfurtransferase